MKHSIKIYPVGNGDCSLITLSDKTTFLVDCKYRAGAEDPDDDSQFDVKPDLLKSIGRRNGNPFVDVFTLTHADKDHCHGFENHFYVGDPSDYGKTNKDNEEIIIDELWVTSALFSSPLSPDANAVRTEANRRIRLRNENHPDKDKPGNRIFLIGYDAGEKFKNVTSYVPGQLVNSFNGKTKADFEIFIHAPFKDDLIKGKADKDRNSTSIVFQARFKINGILVCRAMFYGDADHYVIEQILAKSKKHKNEEYLKYNLKLTAHHCSWTFFNDVSYEIEENQTPQSYSLEILTHKLPGAFMVASSRKIVVEKPNPPHHPAKTEYVKALGNAANFLNTATHPSEDKPEPIEFVIDSAGIQLVNKAKKDKDARVKEALLSTAGRGDKPWVSI